jgi:hypothetical protein
MPVVPDFLRAVTPRAPVLPYVGIKTVIHVIQKIKKPNIHDAAYCMYAFDTVPSLNDPHYCQTGSVCGHHVIPDIHSPYYLLLPN